MSSQSTRVIRNVLEVDYPGKTFARKLPVLGNVSPRETQITRLFAQDVAVPLFELRHVAFGVLTDKDEVISAAVLTRDISTISGSPYPSNLHADHRVNSYLADIAHELFTLLYS